MQCCHPYIAWLCLHVSMQGPAWTKYSTRRSYVDTSQCRDTCFHQLPPRRLVPEAGNVSAEIMFMQIRGDGAIMDNFTKLQTKSYFWLEFYCRRAVWSANMLMVEFLLLVYRWQIRIIFRVGPSRQRSPCGHAAIWIHLVDGKSLLSIWLKASKPVMGMQCQTHQLHPSCGEECCRRWSQSNAYWRLAVNRGSSGSSYHLTPCLTVSRP